MAKNFSQYIEKQLRRRYSNYPNKILVINGVSSDRRDKKELVPFLKEDLEYSLRRIKIKRLERITLFQEIKDEEEEVKKITRLLKYLRK